MIDPALLQALSEGRDILCVSHISPDGDAVGSLLGMGRLLRRLGKQPVLALQDPVPAEHRVLPGAADIITQQSPDFEIAVRQRRFDLIVCVDSSSPDRMGAVYNAPVHDAATLLVIDHHVTNTRFGAINWVAPECAAACQMLVYLADALEVPLEGELAECLLTGIVTDTLCFRTDSTTPDVLSAAMRLMQGSADLSTITAHGQPPPLPPDPAVGPCPAQRAVGGRRYLDRHQPPRPGRGGRRHQEREPEQLPRHRGRG